MKDQPVKYTIGPSQIHGSGVIASAHISPGERIGMVLDLTSGRAAITEHFGIYVNHTYTPNSRLVQEGLVFYLDAIADIRPGEEIAADYRDTPRFFEKPKSYYL